MIRQRNKNDNDNNNFAGESDAAHIMKQKASLCTFLFELSKFMGFFTICYLILIDMIVVTKLQRNENIHSNLWTKASRMESTSSSSSFQYYASTTNVDGKATEKISSFTLDENQPLEEVDNRQQLQDLDAFKTFDEPAIQRIRKIVNSSTFLSWGTVKNKPYNFEEFRIQHVLSQYSLYVQTLHGMSEEEKLMAWKNHGTISSSPAAATTTVSVTPEAAIKATSTTRNYDSPYIWEVTICRAARNFAAAGSIKMHVLFTSCNENWGAFSRYVPNRTKEWGGWTDEGCTDDEIFDYLNHDNTLAVFTTQHHFLDHPKVHSLPLGIKLDMKERLLSFVLSSALLQKKTQWLMINDSGWRHRKNITDTVIQNFQNKSFDNNMNPENNQQPTMLKNTYQRQEIDRYLQEIQRSRFILSPSGMGWDCYRIWEALHFNTIPIIERYGRPHDGWRRSLNKLPVLWVDHFSQVTPELLKQEYRNIVEKARQGLFAYDKLTIPWWIEFIKSKIPSE